MNSNRSLSACMAPYVAISLASFAVPFDAMAQGFEWPEEPENIQVLPDSIRGAALGSLMRGFASALGVRCDHCHVGEGADLSTYDFPADDKQPKRVARLMIDMVQAINGSHLEGLARLGRSRAERVEVLCITCHRGRPRPRMIEDVIVETLNRAGVDSAVAEYRDLRDRFYGGFAYDFRPGPLGTLAEDLAGEGRVDEAIRFLQLALEFEPDSYSTYYTLATVQERAGRTREALASMERALELSPSGFRSFFEREVARLRDP